MTDEGTTFYVGQNSLYPYEDLLVGVGETPTLATRTGYVEVFVISAYLPGRKYLINYEDEDIVKAVRSFRDELQGLLNA